MTPDELAKLTPEERRIRIAEKCGWKRKTRKRYAGEDNVSGWEKDGKFNCYPCQFPDYLSDLNAASTLCDFLAAQGWRCHIDNGLDKTWECTFTHSTELDGMAGCPLFHYAPADTLASAICDAFLLTVG